MVAVGHSTVIHKAAPPALGSPYSFHLHWMALAVILAISAGLVYAIHQEAKAGRPVARIRKLGLAGSVVLLAICSLYPLANWAAKWSASAHMLQQLILVLAIPPLFLSSVPRSMMSRWLAAGPLDDLVQALTKPIAASLVFFSVVVVNQLPPVVAATSSSRLAQGAMEGCLLGAGLVMWAPVLRSIPGARQLSTGARIGYLFIQSLLPNFPALILIFAHHSLYPPFAAHVRAFLHISPVGDQQVAGAMAKLIGIGVLWSTAAAVLTHAQRAEDEGRDPDPLTFEDVEIELRRADRRGTAAG
jgi:putative membrane protein